MNIDINKGIKIIIELFVSFIIFAGAWYLGTIILNFIFNWSLAFQWSKVYCTWFIYELIKSFVNRKE